MTFPAPKGTTIPDDGPVDLHFHKTLFGGAFLALGFFAFRRPTGRWRTEPTPWNTWEARVDELLPDDFGGVAFAMGARCAELELECIVEALRGAPEEIEP